jgi:acetyltransferase-like isoleucine patch superfamily enzyme
MSSLVSSPPDTEAAESKIDGARDGSESLDAGTASALAQRLSRKAVLVGSKWASAVRRAWWRLRGMTIGQGTSLSSVRVTWPHQVQVGRNCTLEPDLYFKYDGPWAPGPSIRIGDNTFLGRGCEFNVSHTLEIGSNGLIASGCTFVDHNHGTARSTPMCEQSSSAAPIVVEDDVWLGVNVTVLPGVRIARGAVVGANAVVTTSIPPFEIWGGVPACKIRSR